MRGFEQRLLAGADEPFTRYYLACAYAVMGERERAPECLEQAARMRPYFTLERTKREVDVESLRDDKRCQQLIGPTLRREKL